MGLRSCPDCEKEVSTSAKACPNCGRPFGVQDAIRVAGSRRPSPLPPLDFDSTVFGRRIPRRVQLGVFWGFVAFGALVVGQFALKRHQDTTLSSSANSSANISDASTPPSVTNALSERVRFVRDVQDHFPGGPVQFTIVGSDSTTLRVYTDEIDNQSWADNQSKEMLRSIAPLAKQRLLDVGFQRLQLVGSTGRNYEWAIADIEPNELIVRVSTDTAVVFVSVDAMNQFAKLVNDGIRDSGLLNSHVSCRPTRGETVALLDVNYRYYSEIAVTSGRSLGCKGWIRNEDLK